MICFQFSEAESNLLDLIEEYNQYSVATVDDDEEELVEEGNYAAEEEAAEE